MSLKEVKQKIRSVKKIRQVTRAMEAVSAVKMRRSQETAIEAGPFAFHGLSILRRVAKSAGASTHPLVKARANITNIKKIGIVVVSSDKGLAGAINSYIFRETHKLIKEHDWAKENISCITVGKKAYEHFYRRGFRIVEHTEHWSEGVMIGDPIDLSQKIINAFLAGEVDEWYLVYTNFHSTFKQEPVVRSLIPISFEGLAETIGGIIPERGKYSELRMLEAATPHEYLFEPSPKEVLDELLPYLVAVELYHAILQSNASEHSSRMVAMKSASDRARDLVKDLTLEYNKERQSSITAEVSEITSGIEAMR